MIKFVNRLSGGEMWVHESRVDEYLRAGHKLALAAASEKKPAPKKSSTAKSTKK